MATPIKPHPYLDGMRFAAFAHRGGGLEQPENSQRAFQAAVDLGYRYIETDVQATSDNVVMVFHDDDLAPITDGEGDISTLPFARVSQAKIHGTEPLMTLEEAFITFPDTYFNIDVKNRHALEPTLELVTRMQVLDRICLASFDDDLLRRIRARLGSAVCTGGGPRDIRKLKFASWGMPLKRIYCHCAQVPVAAKGITIPTRRFNKYCNAKGVVVHVWTIDEADEMRRLIRSGVNGIVTDRPTLLKQIAIEEGVW